MHSVYNYIDPAEFLRVNWEKKKIFNPNFSLRAWSKNLSMEAHGPLHQMLSGKRTIPKKYVQGFCKSLELSAKEALYFETMVDLQRAKSLEQKEFYTQRLKTLSPKPLLQMKEIDTYKYLKNPLCTILLELSTLNGFKADVDWIKNAIRIDAQKADIQAAIDTLLALDLIQIENGAFIKKQQHLYSKQDVKDLGLREYHKSVCDMAKEQIEKQDIEDREYNAYAISVRRESIPKAKKLIREFMSEFAKEIEASQGNAERLYHLNIQFFEITK
ncbi:MAG: TIGR02147 family protein [Bacteriovoracaceae bacterium]